MFNGKLTAIAGGSAFVLAFLIALVAGGGFGVALFRGLIMALVFSALASAVWFALNQFLPELLGGAVDQYDPSPTEPQPRSGAAVDIVVGDDVPVDEVKEGSSPSPEELGSQDEAEQGGLDAFSSDFSNAENPVGLDQGREGGYTGDIGGAKPASVASATVARPPQLIEGVDVLPDMDGMADSFVSPVLDGEEKSVEAPKRSSTSVNLGTSSGSNFDSKEIALAVQTMLKRDREG